MATVIRIEPKLAKEAIHTECGAVISYYPYETRDKYHADYGGGGDTYSYLRCPHCGKEFSFIKRY